MSDRPPVFAIDANVILRYLLGDDERLSTNAATILQGVDRGETAVSCDPVTLAEVVWVLSSYYGLPNPEISEGLAPLLKAEGFLVHIETNVSVPRPPAADWYSVSPKPPDYKVNPSYLRIADEVKLVVTRGLTLGNVQAVRRAFPDTTPLLLQPQSNLGWSVRRGWALVRRSLAAGLPNIRLGIQAHKVLRLP